MTAVRQYDDWTGIDHPEERIALNQSAAQARAWDMHPRCAARWISLGATSRDADVLLHANLDVEDSRWWLANGHDAHDVAQAFLAVRGARGLEDWVRAGFTLAEAVGFVNAGIDPSEAGLFADRDVVAFLAGIRTGR